MAILFGKSWCFYSVSCGIFIRRVVVLSFGKLLQPEVLLPKMCPMTASWPAAPLL